MTLLPEPDILGAITARLRSFSEINTATSGRIAGELGKDWFTGGEARAAIRVRRTGGPVIPERRMIGQAFARLDVWCYGSSARAAGDLMGYALAALCPLQGTAGSFTQAVTNSGSVRVYDIFPNAEPISDREPDTGYRYSWVPIIADYSLVNA